MAYIRKILFIIYDDAIIDGNPERLNKEVITSTENGRIDFISLTAVDYIGNTISATVRYSEDYNCCLIDTFCNYRTSSIRRFSNYLFYRDSESLKLLFVEPYDYPSLDELKESLMSYIYIEFEKQYSKGSIVRPCSADVIDKTYLNETFLYGDYAKFLSNNNIEDNYKFYQEIRRSKKQSNLYTTFTF